MKKRFSFLPPWPGRAGMGLLLALLWSFSCLLPACKKDAPGPSVIQGRITEYGTQTPVETAKIYLSCDDSQFGGPPIFKLFDSLATDADGRYYKEYPDGEFCANVIIQPYKKGYFVPTPLDYVTVSKSYDFVLDPEAWLKVRCIPDQGQLSMNFQILSYAEEVQKSKGDTTYRFFGGTSLRGNRSQRISWRTYPNQLYHQDTIYLAAHDTTTFIIHY